MVVMCNFEYFESNRKKDFLLNSVSCFDSKWSLLCCCSHAKRSSDYYHSIIFMTLITAHTSATWGPFCFGMEICEIQDVSKRGNSNFMVQNGITNMSNLVDSVKLLWIENYKLNLELQMNFDCLHAWLTFTLELNVNLKTVCKIH